MKSKTFLSCLVFIFFFLSSSSSSSIFSRHFPSIPSVSGLICTQNLTPSETSASLQAIIDSLGSSTSAVLCFSAGTYSFSNTLNVTAAGVTFQGPQSGIDPRPSASSTRSPTNAATEAIFSGASLTSGMPLISMQTDSITFDGLVLTGTPSGSFLNDLLRAEAKTGLNFLFFLLLFAFSFSSPFSFFSEKTIQKTKKKQPKNRIDLQQFRREILCSSRFWRWNDSLELCFELQRSSQLHLFFKLCKSHSCQHQFFRWIDSKQSIREYFSFLSFLFFSFPFFLWIHHFSVFFFVLKKPNQNS